MSSKKSIEDMPLPTNIPGIWVELFKMLKAQGLSFILLAAAVWWFNMENQSLKKKVEDCSQEMIKIYQQQNDALLNTLMDSKEILKRIEQELIKENTKNN